MFGQLKKMWGYYIALLTVIAVLSYHIVWVYQVVLRRFGEDIALLALTATMIAVVILAIRGAVYASMLDGILRGQVMALKNPPNPGTTIQPFEQRKQTEITHVCVHQVFGGIPSELLIADRSSPAAREGRNQQQRQGDERNVEFLFQLKCWTADSGKRLKLRELNRQGALRTR